MEIILNAISIGVIMVLVPLITSTLRKISGINADVSYRAYGIVIIIGSLILGLIPILMNIFPGNLKGTDTLVITTAVLVTIISIFLIFGMMLCKYSVEIRHNKIVVTGWTGRVREYLYEDIVRVIEDENRNIVIYFKNKDTLLVERLFEAARLHLELYLQNHSIKVEPKYTINNFVILHKVEEILGWVYLILTLLLSLTFIASDPGIAIILCMPGVLLIAYAKNTRLEFIHDKIIVYSLLRRKKEINHSEIDYIKKYQDNQAIVYKVYTKNKFKFKVFVSDSYKGSYYFERLLSDKHWRIE